MQVQPYTFLSDQDGLAVHGIKLVPERPRAVLQLAHGMCEHKERYLPFMAYMAQAGYACFMHDHRGHGESLVNPQALGYFGKNGGRALVEDLRQATGLIKREMGDLPFFLFGHSMGSLAVRAYAKRYDDALDGLIVCGCPANNPLSGVGSLLTRALALFKGDQRRSALLDRLFTGAFERTFADEELPHSWICSDPQVVHAYNEDPLCNFTFTINGYESLLWLVRDVYDLSGWKVSRPDLPIRFVSGRQDPCLIDEKRFDAAVSSLREVGYRAVQARLFDDMRHEILNERAKESVYGDLQTFLNHLS